MAQTAEATKRSFTPVPVTDGFVAHRIDRRVVDLLISWTGAVVAFALIALGAAAIFGGSFAMDNVRDELTPQKVTFKPLDAMTPEEKAQFSEYAGVQVTNGSQAEAFSRYISLHLADVNEGKTYSETSTELRAVDAEAEPELAADLGAKRQTLFMGEMLRGTMLNAYGWWTVGQITFFAGIGMVIAGAILAVLVGLGFRHARKVS